MLGCSCSCFREANSRSDIISLLLEIAALTWVTSVREEVITALVTAMLPDVNPAKASAANCSNGSWLDVLGEVTVLEATGLGSAAGGGTWLGGRLS